MTITRSLLDSNHYPLKAPRLFQEVQGNSVLAAEMTSDPVSCTITENARLWLDAENYIALDSDGIVIASLPHTDETVFKGASSKTVHLSGRSLKLSAQGDFHYYHWMVDALPKIAYMALADISLESIDHFIVTQLAAPFHRETLTRLGIPANKIVETRDSPDISCDELIDVRMGNFVGMTMPRFVPEFLRDTFLENPAETKLQDTPSEARRFYIGRPRSLMRRVVENEDELVALLGQFGFEHLEMENYTVIEQARLFDSADVIVTPHGGALTNLVYCGEGTRVVELFSNHVFSYFFGLANLCQLDYAAVLANPGHYDRVIDPWVGNSVSDQHVTGPENFARVNLQVLEKALEGIGLSRPTRDAA